MPIFDPTKVPAGSPAGAGYRDDATGSMVYPDNSPAPVNTTTAAATAGGNPQTNIDNANADAGIVGTSQPVKDSQQASLDADAAAKKAAEVKLATDTKAAELLKLQNEANGVEPGGGNPAKPDYVKTYEDLRSSQGITSIQDRLASIRNEKASLYDHLDKFKRNQGGIAQSDAFAKGNLSREQGIAQDRLNTLSRLESNEVENLNSRNAYISEVMNLTGKNYGEARSEYEFEYNKNVQMQNSMNNESDRQLTRDQTALNNANTDLDRDVAAKALEESKKAAQDEREKNDARTYLTTVQNMIANSGKSWAELTPAMRAEITNNEIKAGFAPGTMEAFAKVNPKATLIGSRSGYDENGNGIESFFYDKGDGHIGVTEVKSGQTRKGDQNSALEQNLNSTQGIKDYVAANPDVSRTDLAAKMAKLKIKDKQATALLDAAKVYDPLPSDQIDKAIEMVDQGIQAKENGWFHKLFSGKGDDFDKAVKSAQDQINQGYITLSSTDAKGKTVTKSFKLNDDTQKKFLDSIDKL